MCTHLIQVRVGRVLRRLRSEPVRGEPSCPVCWQPLARLASRLSDSHRLNWTPVAAVTPISLASSLPAPAPIPQAHGSPLGSMRQLTRTQRIRTAARVPIEAIVIDRADVPVYLTIGNTAKHLRELGMSDRAIARALGVSDKTAAKAAGAVGRRRASRPPGPVGIQ